MRRVGYGCSWKTIIVILYDLANSCRWNFSISSSSRLVSSSQLNSSWLYNEIVANFCKQLTGLDPCQRQEQQHYADEGKGCRLLLTSFRRVHLARSGFTWGRGLRSENSCRTFYCCLRGFMQGWRLKGLGNWVMCCAMNCKWKGSTCLSACLPACWRWVRKWASWLWVWEDPCKESLLCNFTFLSLSPSPSSPCYSLEVVLLLILHRIVLVYLHCASSLLPSQVEYGFRTFLRTGMLLESWGILCFFDRGEFKENTFHGKVLMSFTFVASKK